MLSRTSGRILNNRRSTSNIKIYQMAPLVSIFDEISWSAIGKFLFRDLMEEILLQCNIITDECNVCGVEEFESEETELNRLIQFTLYVSRLSFRFCLRSDLSPCCLRKCCNSSLTSVFQLQMTLVETPRPHGQMTKTAHCHRTRDRLLFSGAARTFQKSRVAVSTSLRHLNCIINSFPSATVFWASPCLKHRASIRRSAGVEVVESHRPRFFFLPPSVRRIFS
jgi:hypothetical protein